MKQPPALAHPRLAVAETAVRAFGALVVCLPFRTETSRNRGCGHRLLGFKHVVKGIPVELLLQYSTGKMLQQQPTMLTLCLEDIYPLIGISLSSEKSVRRQLGYTNAPSSMYILIPHNMPATNFEFRLRHVPQGSIDGRGLKLPWVAEPAPAIRTGPQRAVTARPPVVAAACEVALVAGSVSATCHLSRAPGGSRHLEATVSTCSRAVVPSSCVIQLRAYEGKRGDHSYSWENTPSPRGDGGPY